MKFRKWLLALTSACLIATAAFAQLAKLYPVRDFFKKPDQTAFRLSPDGKTLRLMQPYESRLNILVQPIDKMGSKDGRKRLTSETVRATSRTFSSRARSMCSTPRILVVMRIFTS